jgi:hypothetical protein
VAFSTNRDAVISEKARPRANVDFDKKPSNHCERQKKKTRRQWDVWDTLTEDVRKLREELRPERPREFHEE